MSGIHDTLTRFVPDSWERSRLRRLGRVINGGTPAADPENWDGDLPFITPPDLRRQLGKAVGNTERTLTVSGARSGSVIVSQGVILSNRAPIGYVARIAEPSAFNQGCKAIVGGRGDDRFLMYVLLAAEPILTALGQGTTFMELGTSDLEHLGVPFPPLSEQRTIADFLDRETAKIDALIEKQARLVERLRERRSSTITHFATQGLDPEAPTRESQSDYLGAIPEHWVESHFGLEMTVNGGLVDPREEPWSDMIMVAPNHIEPGTGRLIGRETAAEQGADSGKYLVDAGQIIYSKIRPALNKVTIAVEDCLCSADMYGLTSRKRDDHRYLVYFMLAQPFHVFASEMSARVKMPKINRDELGAAPWLRPPLAEQRAIADHLDRETAKIDALIAKAERFVELARERRSALITAAVTGQLDITERQAS